MTDPLKEKNTPWRDEELMERLAIEEESQQKIADKINTSRQTVGIWLRKFNFEDLLKENPWENKSKLLNAYFDLGEQKKVAEKFGCSCQTISKWMDKFDIPVRKKHPSHPFYNEEKLRNLYEKHQSVERVREELNCSPNLLNQWMNHHGIERNWKHKNRGEKVEVDCSQCGYSETVYESIRKTTEKWFCSLDCMGSWQSENQTGKNSPSWEGGSVPYIGSWLRVRDQVRERDENVCQKCGKGGENRLPDVHHIEPVRSFDDPKDAHFLENLIQLCRPCHGQIEKYSPEKQQEILNIE